MIRMTTDRLGGTTYSYTNLNAFLANQPATVQYLGDESAPSVFNNGATGLRHLQNWFGIGYAQDEWRGNRRVTPEQCPPRAQFFGGREGQKAPGETKPQTRPDTHAH